MSQYKERLKFERLLIKKINRWFTTSKLMGLSIDALNSWVLNNNIDNNTIGVQNMLKISQRLKALANRSQEVVDPTLTIELNSLSFEIELLNKEQFVKVTMPNTA